MSRLLSLFAFAVAILLSGIAAVRAADTSRGLPLAKGAVGLTLRAVGDFHAVTESAFAPSYAEKRGSDTSTHGLAVNPKIAADRFAAAEASFRGGAGLYTIRRHAVAEEDGESVYELLVDGKNLGRRINPRVAEKRVAASHVWENVRLTPGVQLRVLFAGRSNGLHPEGDVFAWSRGRWRSLEIVPGPAP